MPTPTKPSLIALKSSSLTSADRVTFRNLTRGGKVTVQCKDTEAILQSFPSEWQNGDEISCEIYGRFNKATKLTLAAGGASSSLELSADSTTVAINL